jgi:hypothetical protein
MVYAANDPVFDGGKFKSFGQLMNDRANGFATIDFANSREASNPDFDESGTNGLKASLGDFHVDCTKQCFVVQKARILVIA